MRHTHSNIIGRFASDRRGNIAIIFGLSIMPVLAMAGMSIDYARAFFVRSKLQQASDAAASAASYPVNKTDTERSQIALNVFAANVSGNSQTRNVMPCVAIGSATNCPNGAAPTGTITTASGASTSGITVSAASSIPAYFMSILRPTTLPVSANASGVASTQTTQTTTTYTTKTVTTPGYTPCLHVMSQSAGPAWNLISNSDFDASGCIARVRSNKSNALTSVSSSNVKFKEILVKGGASVSQGSIIIIDSPNTITQNTTTDVVGDPYSSAINSVISNITVDKCTSKNSEQTFTKVNVSPGTYCGNTTFNGVTFAPGLYIIASGGCNGSLNLKGLLDGSAGVTFYFADNKSQFGSYTAAEGSVLKAPISGNTQGILFFENSNRGNGYTFTINSVNKQSWKGIVYFPSMDMRLISLSEWPSMNISLSVNTLYMNSLSSVMLPYSWTPSGASTAITFGGSTTTVTTPVTTTTTTDTIGFVTR